MPRAALLCLLVPTVACAQDTPPPVQKAAESYLTALSTTGDDAGRSLLLGGVTLDARLSSVDSWKIVSRDYAKKETGALKTAATLMAELDKAGLLLDFKELKEVLRPVMNYLDHEMINELKPFDTINPSAENLAKYFYDETNSRLSQSTSGRVKVKDVTIWETDTTTARYSE